jgi:multidrug efflux pump
MTSVATVFGHLPLVFVSGPGSEARNSIGTVLVAGMTVGSLFTLVVVPVFYSLIATEHQPHSVTAEFRAVEADGRLPQGNLAPEVALT